MGRKPASDEFLDGVQQRSRVAQKEQVVLAGEFDVAGAVDVLGLPPFYRRRSLYRPNVARERAS
jgi:hypothetical protein